MINFKTRFLFLFIILSAAKLALAGTVFPVLGLTAYNNFIKQGYICKPHGQDIFWGKGNGYCVKNDPKFSVGQIVDNMNNRGNQVVMVTKVHGVNDGVNGDGCTAAGACMTMSCSVTGAKFRTTYEIAEMECTSPAV